MVYQDVSSTWTPPKEIPGEDFRNAESEILKPQVLPGPGSLPLYWRALALWGKKWWQTRVMVEKKEARMEAGTKQGTDPGDSNPNCTVEAQGRLLKGGGLALSLDRSVQVPLPYTTERRALQLLIFLHPDVMLESRAMESGHLPQMPAPPARWWQIM